MHPWGDIGTAHEVASNPRPGYPPHTRRFRGRCFRRHHALACNGSDVACGCGRRSICARAYSSLLLLLSRLQRRCVSLTLSHASGSPPRDTGMISSTSGLIGCGERNALSTGCPQIAHVSYAASTRARSCRRRCPFAVRGLARLITRSPIRSRPRTVHAVRGRIPRSSYSYREISSIRWFISRIVKSLASDVLATVAYRHEHFAYAVHRLPIVLLAGRHTLPPLGALP